MINGVNSLEHAPTQHHYFLRKLSLLSNTTSFVSFFTIYSPCSTILSIVHAIRIKNFLVGKEDSKDVFFPKVTSHPICKFHSFTLFKICESWFNTFLVRTISYILFQDSDNRPVRNIQFTGKFSD